MAEFGGGDPLATLIQAIIFGNTPAALRLIRSGMPLDGVLAQTLHGTTWWSAPIISAVMMKNVEVFEALLESGASPNTALPDGLTALEFASRSGQKSIVRTLIERGADIEPRRNQLIGSGWPMLHCAAWGGNLNIVKLLLERGADPGARDESGKAALDIAVQYQHDAVAGYLRERMAASHTIGLHEAAADGLLERVLELLDGGAPVDAREPVRQRTALHLAVVRERFKVAKALMERGADVNVRDAIGHVCLTLCRNYESVRLLKLLLQAGADPNSGGPDGLTPFLWHVRQRAGIKILRILLDAGADVRARSADGKGALELAPSDTASVRRHLKDLLGVAPDEIEQVRDHLKQLPVLAEQPKFQALAARLGEIFGRKPAPWKLRKGGIYFHDVSLQKYPARPHIGAAPTGPRGYESLPYFVNVQEDVHAEGFTLLHGDLTRAGDRASLILLPTANQYAGLMARGTNGINYGHTTRAIVSWLMEMEKVNSFVLTGCGMDFLFGRFVGTVRDPEEWAKKMIALCPDLDDSKPDAAERLARELSESRWFYFWWD